MLIARADIEGPKTLSDPDANRVSLVGQGPFGIERIGIRLGVRDIEQHRRFYTEALGLQEAGSVGEASTFRSSTSTASMLTYWRTAAAKPALRRHLGTPRECRWCAIRMATGLSFLSGPRSPGR